SRLTRRVLRLSLQLGNGLHGCAPSTSACGLSRHRDASESTGEMRPAMRILVAALAALALVPTALSGGPRMEIGSVLEEAEQPTFAEAQQRVALADQAALGGA